MPEPASGAASDRVALVRDVYERWLAGTRFAEMADLFEGEFELWADPEAWWVGVEKVFRGRNALDRYMRAANEAFEDYRPEVEDIRDAGGARVVVLAIEHGRRRDSEAGTEASRTAHVWTIRESKAVKLQLFLDRGRAKRELDIDIPA